MNSNDLIGTIGVGIILIAYFLNMFSLIPNNGKLFYLLNIIGASIACFASYLIKISLMLEYISPDFINTAINSAYFRQTQINPEITQQCGQANFNGTKLKNTLIPLPPLAEQKRIVTKVDKLMKLCDELETKLTQTQTESEKIINAAVKQFLTV
jgi:restriction endonuclease S subunit